MSLFSAKKLLIVDDEPLLRAVLDEYLGMCGFDVSVVQSGNEAYSLLTREHFDAVLSDVRMSDGDGITLMKKIASDLTSPPKVFFYTGGIEAEFASQAGALGAAGIFRKPCELEEIATGISKALAGAP